MLNMTGVTGRRKDYSRPEKLIGLFELYDLSTQNIERYARELESGAPISVRVNDISTLRVHRTRYELVRD